MANFIQLLERTSRTFGLSIPLLSPPVREEMTLAYLVFRVADTLEDADSGTREQRLEALAQLKQLVQSPTHAHAVDYAQRWVAWRPSSHEGYLELLAATPELFQALSRCGASARQAILHHAARTIAGMFEFVQRADAEGQLQFESLPLLMRYCYVVAGIVGELITELFLYHYPQLRDRQGLLETDAAAFGEGLQLVNILKDADADARCGRRFLPPDVPRTEVFQLARMNLQRAEAYVETLREARAPTACIAFAELPTRLAWKTLERVEQQGAGAKLDRQEVASILREVQQQTKS